MTTVDYSSRGQVFMWIATSMSVEFQCIVMSQ